MQRERPMLSDEGPMLETLAFTIYIGGTPAFLYFHFRYLCTFIAGRDTNLHWK